MANKEETIENVGTAFQEAPEGLTSQQQKAFEGVGTAFNQEATERTILGSPRATIDNDIVKANGVISQVSDSQKRRDEINARIIQRQKEAEAERQKQEAEAEETAQFTQEEKDELGITKLEKTQEQKDLETNIEELNKQTKDVTDKLDIASANMTDSQRALIDAIKGKFEVRRKQQEDINKRTLALQTTAGLRRGTAQFAPEIQTSILSAEESAGLQKISELDALEAETVADAELALSTENFKQLSEKLKRIDDVKKEKQEALNKLKQVQEEEQERMEEKIKENMAGDAVFNAMAGGNLTTSAIYSNLRNQGISITPDEVDKIRKSFIPEPSKETTFGAYEFKNEDVGKLISAGFSGEDIQTIQDVVNKHGLYGIIPELDGVSFADTLQPKQLQAVKDILYPIPADKGKSLISGKSYDDLTTGTRLGKMIYGTRIANEETKRIDSIIELGKLEGKDEFDIMDDILGYRIEPEHKEIGDGLRFAMMTAGGEKGLLGFDVIGVARLINSGQYLGAVQKIENTKIKEAQDLVGRDSFVAEADVDYINNKVKDIEDLLGEGFFDEVGAFTGNLTGWLTKKGFSYGQSVKIKAKVTNIIADMVNKRAGSAITEEEWDRIVAPNVPNISDGAKTFKDKLDELVGDTLERYNSERKMVSLPELSKNNISNPETRISLYAGDNEIDDILNSIGNDIDYNPNIWQ
jgi:hypothetical protein